MDSRPDAVVLDRQLRQGNGINVLRRLHGLAPSIHPLVIVLTSYNNAVYRTRAKEAGSDYFFDKVSEFHRVSEVLRDLADPHPIVQ